MNLKPIYIAVLVLVAAAVGRYTAPEKIKIEKEVTTVETSKKDTNADTKTDASRDKHLEKITTEVLKPDGTREVTTRVVEDSTTNRRTEKTVDSREESGKTIREKDTKEIESKSGRLSLSVLAGASGFPPSSITYGGHIQKNFIGPINIGVWGLATGTFGFSLGLSF